MTASNTSTGASGNNTPSSNRSNGKRRRPDISGSQYAQAGRACEATPAVARSSAGPRTEVSVNSDACGRLSRAADTRPHSDTSLRSSEREHWRARGLRHALTGGTSRAQRRPPATSARDERAFGGTEVTSRQDPFVSWATLGARLRPAWPLAAAVLAAQLAACGADGADGADGTAGTQTGAGAETGSVAAPTFWQDVAPIVEARCSTCHRDGGIAPFAFDGYENARLWSRAAADAVQARVMPPWLMNEDGSCQSFASSRYLTAVPSTCR